MAGEQKEITPEVRQLSCKPLKILFVFQERPVDTLEILIKSFSAQDVILDISTAFPINTSEYDLVVPWNYQNKILSVPPENNVVVFHSSDLPKGRGWAPIAQLFLQEIPFYTLTAIFIDANIDTGRMILKATFPITNSMTARHIRAIDDWLIICLSLDIARALTEARTIGIPQTESNASYYPRRHPAQSQLRPSDTLESMVPLLRAAEEGHECFFLLGDTKYFLKATPIVNATTGVNVKVSYLSTGDIQNILLRIDDENLRVSLAP